MAASKFTDEYRSGLLERIRIGVSLPDACRAVGVRHKTVKAWLTRGRREEEGEYARFALDVEQARDKAGRARQVPMTEAEHRLAVSDAGRAGSVAALKLYWEILLEDRKRDPEEEKSEPGSLEALDELAARRMTR
jgi:hypothetical protein